MLRKSGQRCSKMVLGASLVATSAAWGQANVQQDVVFVSGPTDACASGPVFDREVRPGQPDGRVAAVKPASSAPYSAVGTTRMIRTLGDGNRIVRTNTMRYARDSQGRTRTEYSLAALGPFALEEARSMITIEDPIAGRRYVLHPELRRADAFDVSAMQGSSRGELRSSFMAGSIAAARTDRAVAAPTVAPDAVARSGVAFGTSVAVAGSPFMVMSSGVGPMAFAGCGPQDPLGRRTPAPVSLGERMMEGVKAVGSRHEFEIEAGSIGNEQAIVIRTEQWFSPDLGVVIESTHQDPMSGDTSYKLTQIRRGEPDAALFKVPAGYTTEQMPKFEKFEMRPAPPAGSERGD